MLRCSDRSYYVGSATGDDLTKRIAEHYAGAYEGYTSIRRPVTLVWSEHFELITDAIAAERKIKGWRRAKKEALINSDWSALKSLSQTWGNAEKIAQSAALPRPSPFEARRCATRASG